MRPGRSDERQEQEVKRAADEGEPYRQETSNRGTRIVVDPPQQTSGECIDMRPFLSWSLVGGIQADMAFERCLSEDDRSSASPWWQVHSWEEGYR